MASKISDKSVRELVFNKYGGKCSYCGCLLSHPFHIDHLIPKRRYSYVCNPALEKGKDIVENFMPSCISCNTSKSDLSIEQFRERVFDRLRRLNNSSTEYRIAKRFGLVTENITPIVFHFEKV